MDAGSSPPKNVSVITMIDPAAAGVNLIAQKLTNFDVNVITTQPARPRTIRCVFGGGWDGGDIEVTGIDVGGDPAIDVIAAALGTVEGVIPFAVVTRIRNLDVAMIGGTVNVQTGLGLGLPCKRGSMDALIRTSVDNAYEANGTVDLVNSTVRPTTVPNAGHDYEFWVAQRINVGD